MTEKLDINYLAKLSKLKIHPNEYENYENELNKILDLMEQLKCIDTKNIEPMAHPLNLSQRLREDEITETDESNRFQSIAPKVEDHLYLVPKVIENQ